MVVNAWLKAFLSLRASKAAGTSLTSTSCLSDRLVLGFGVIFLCWTLVQGCSLLLAATVAYEVVLAGIGWVLGVAVVVGLSRRLTFSLSSFETLEREEIWSPKIAEFFLFILPFSV